MTKFCIELEDMALPDAIAAVVEAWLDAQSEENTIISRNAMLESMALKPYCEPWKDSEIWEKELRRHLFSRCDYQWTIGPAEQQWTNKLRHPGMPSEKFNQKNKIHLTYFDAKNRQRWILLPCEWSNENIELIHDWVTPIVDWVEDENKTLANAYKRVKSLYDEYDEDFI